MVLVGPVLVGTVVVLGATPSSASGSLGAVAAAWASLVSDRLATRSDCTVPARSAGVSLLAELKMKLATPIRSNTSASPVSGTLQRCTVGPEWSVGFRAGGGGAQRIGRGARRERGGQNG